jgi:uncharacterized membrane protein YgcG
MRDIRTGHYWLGDNCEYCGVNRAQLSAQAPCQGTRHEDAPTQWLPSPDIAVPAWTPTTDFSSDIPDTPSAPDTSFSDAFSGGESGGGGGGADYSSSSDFSSGGSSDFSGGGGGADF